MVITLEKIILISPQKQVVGRAGTINRIID